MDKTLNAYLEKHNIKYKIYEHKAVFTVEEAVKIKEKIPAQHAKCLFLKSQSNKFYLVAMNAFKKLNTNLLQKYLHVKKLRFASPEELKQELNLTPGSVSIFGMIYTDSVTLILDKEVWQADKVGFHPNINTATLVIDHENLGIFYNSLSTQKIILDIESFE